MIIPIPNSFFVITETCIRIKPDVGVHIFPQNWIKKLYCWQMKAEARVNLNLINLVIGLMKCSMANFVWIAVFYSNYFIELACCNISVVSRKYCICQFYLFSSFKQILRFNCLLLHIFYSKFLHIQTKFSLIQFSNKNLETPIRFAEII